MFYYLDLKVIENAANPLTRAHVGNKHNYYSKDQLITTAKMYLYNRLDTVLKVRRLHMKRRRATAKESGCPEALSHIAEKEKQRHAEDYKAMKNQKVTSLSSPTRARYITSSSTTYHSTSTTSATQSQPRADITNDDTMVAMDVDENEEEDFI